MIKRKLKNHLWEFDEVAKLLIITNCKLKQSVSLDKTRMFSLFRFLIRVSQRMSTKRRKEVSA